MNAVEIFLLAVLLDLIFGDPKWLWKRVPHPVQLIGFCIETLDQKLNTGSFKMLKGFGAIALLIMLAGILGLGLQLIPDFGILEMLLVAILLAHKSLVQHVRNVAAALRQSVEQGRVEVSKIVGRTTDNMTKSDVARAAIESAAENFSDGVIAPAFWYLVCSCFGCGLSGILIYKTLNTADSMIGYKTEKYKAFGYAAAKLDDVLNWVPSRLTGLMICVLHTPKQSLDIVLDDAPLHRSPNAGWPEAAMAAVLNISLAGPRSYNGEKIDYPYLNAEARQHVDSDDIRRCITALNTVWIGFASVFVVGLWIF